MKVGDFLLSNDSNSEFKAYEVLNINETWQIINVNIYSHDNDVFSGELCSKMTAEKIGSGKTLLIEKDSEKYFKLKSTIKI